MSELSYEAVESKVYSLWKTSEYERAVDFLKGVISAYKGEDVSVLELCYTLLRSSFVTLVRYSDAEMALRDGLNRLPNSFFLRRALAQFLWDIAKQPEQALAVIDKAIDEHNDFPDSPSSASVRIQALSLRGRLLIAVGRPESSLATLRTILTFLPSFSPVAGHLFDYDLIADLLSAGVRDVALRDLVNRVTEPRFLVNGISEAQFDKMKQYLNSADYLPLAEEQ